MRKYAGIALVLLTALWPLAGRAQEDGGSADASMGTCTADSYEANNDIASAKPVTAGTISNLTACDNDENDWYSITVPANNGIMVSIDFLDAQADLDLYIYNAAATATSLHSSAGTTDGEKVYKEIFAAQTQVLIKVRNYNWDDSMWAPYTMTVSLHPGGYDPCAPDDSYEPNDTLATAKPITAGAAITGLIGCDDDWYSLSVPANNGVVVDATFLDEDGNIDLYLYDAAATATSLHSSTSSDDNEKVYAELFAAATTVLIRVRSDYSRPQQSYSLQATLHAGGYDPCAPDDSREPNDDPTAASAITVPGTVDNLVGCDDDWYSFTLPAGQGALVDIAFTDADADLDLYIYEAADPVEELDSSTSTTDDEQVCASPVSAATEMLVQVLNYNQSSGMKADYTLTVTLQTTECAGSSGDDAGVSTDGSGGTDSASGTDAGVVTGTDAATGGDDDDDDTGGCGCSGFGLRSSGALALLGLAVLAIRRRR